MQRASFIALFGAALLLSASVQAQEPTFKKYEDEKKMKAFASEVFDVCVRNARTSGVSAGSISLDEFKLKAEEGKPGREQLILKGTYKGKVSRQTWKVDVTIALDTSNAEKWEVLRVDYSDNAKGTPWNRKNIEGLVNKFNGK